MANPQVENGFTRIANELLEALLRAPICGAGFRIVLYLIRNTYGRQKVADRMTQTQMATAVSMTRGNLNRELQLLIGHNIVRRNGDIYSINKDYDTWQPDRGGRRRTKTPTTKPGVITSENDTHDLTSDNSMTSLLITPVITSEVTPVLTSEVLQRKKRNSSKEMKEGAATTSAATDHQQAIDYWCSEYTKATGLKYSFAGVKEGQMIKALLRDFSLDRLQALMSALIYTDDNWLRSKRGITISTLKSECNTLAQKIQGVNHVRTQHHPELAKYDAIKSA
jgi:phage replication O-like protein O